MWSRTKTLVLAVVVVTATLAPLFGDVRITPITHPMWGRLLLRSMDMAQAVQATTEASQVFSALAWRDSMTFPAGDYVRADGAVVRDDGGEAVVTPAAGPAEIVYAVPVAQPGDYQVRARFSGPAGAQATAEVAPLAGGNPLETFTLVAGGQPAWVFGGTAHLDPGTYGAAVLLPPGCSLSQLEVAPPCLNPIEPPGGWQPEAVTTGLDVAVTALRALDMEHELPPAASAIEVEAGQFQVEAPPEAVETRIASTSLSLAEQGLRAGRKGLRAVVTVDIPDAGLYSLSGFISPGGGQRWLVDGCRKAVVCAGETAGWRPIMAQRLAVGRHTLLVSLANGATLDRVRFERRKDDAEDYVGTLERLGFTPPQGPITRDQAVEAMRFVRDQRRERLSRLCGDTVVVDDTPLPPLTVADDSLPGPTDSVAPVAPLPPPITPPILPPQEPASPDSPTS